VKSGSDVTTGYVTTSAPQKVSAHPRLDFGFVFFCGRLPVSPLPTTAKTKKARHRCRALIQYVSV
jgi:hypothetical protein